LTNTSTTKVIILLPSLAGGGAERTVMNILKAYDRNKFTIKVLLISNEGEYSSSFCKDDIVYNQSDFFASNFFRQLYFFVCKTIPFHFRSLRSEKPDVVMTVTESMNYYGYFLNILGALKCTWIIRSGNNIFAEARSKGFFIGRFLKLLLRKTYRRANHIITLSNGAKKSIQDKFKIHDKNITTIYNPIDLEKIDLMSSSTNAVALDKPFFIGIGRLAKQKRFDIMIKAFHESDVHNKGYQLIILGEGPERASLQKQVNNYSLDQHVKFMGFQDNPYVYLRHAKCFLLSSEWEGFAHVIAEALACDTEVISIDCKFGPSEILSNGKYGKIINADEPNLFRDAIRRFVENKDQNKHSDKKQRASDFDLNIIVPHYEMLLSKLAK
jgi:glycosyltransferase involved in cell wall biosynthesis